MGMRTLKAAAGNPPEYPLGSSDAEQERLIRQASRLAPLTERAFLDAGVGAGQRVLELGSGVGDVAMLAAQVVGPGGEVVGIERDRRSILRAQTRVDAAGLGNVRFVEIDISRLPGAGAAAFEAAAFSPSEFDAAEFDAAVGRFILQFLPDPAAVLRGLARVVRPGGVLVFQEVSYAPLLPLAGHLPLWSSCVALARDSVQRLGARPEMGVALHQTFQDAGLPAPTMRMDVLLDSTPDFTLWIYEVLRSLRPHIEQHCDALQALGDFETLWVRLLSELAATRRRALPSRRQRLVPRARGIACSSLQPWRR